MGNRLLPAFISGRGGHEGKSLEDYISTTAPDTLSTAHSPDVKPGAVSTSTSLSACTPVTSLSPSSSLSSSSSSSKPCFGRGGNQSHQLLHQSNDCVTLQVGTVPTRVLLNTVLVVAVHVTVTLHAAVPEVGTDLAFGQVVGAGRLSRHAVRVSDYR